MYYEIILWLVNAGFVVIVMIYLVWLLKKIINLTLKDASRDKERYLVSKTDYENNIHLAKGVIYILTAILTFINFIVNVNTAVTIFVIVISLFECADNFMLFLFSRSKKKLANE